MQMAYCLALRIINLKQAIFSLVPIKTSSDTSIVLVSVGLFYFLADTWFKN